LISNDLRFLEGILKANNLYSIGSSCNKVSWKITKL